MTELRKQANRMMFNQAEDEFIDGALGWARCGWLGLVLVWVLSHLGFPHVPPRSSGALVFSRAAPGLGPLLTHPYPLLPARRRRGHHRAGRDWQGGQRPPARGGHAAAPEAERQGAEEGGVGDGMLEPSFGWSVAF